MDEVEKKERMPGGDVSEENPEHVEEAEDVAKAGNEQEPTTPGESETFGQRIAELETRLSAAVAAKEKESDRVKELNGMYVRLQADFDNYRKRTSEQLGKAREDGVAEAMSKVIPTLDVIGQALQMIDDEKVAEGVRMIDRQLLGVLNAFGVTEIPALGKDFDPELHNAIIQVKADKPENEGRVIEVFQKGYRMGDRILRHSVVKVAR